MHILSKVLTRPEEQIINNEGSLSIVTTISFIIDAVVTVLVIYGMLYMSNSNIVVVGIYSLYTTLSIITITGLILHMGWSFDHSMMPKSTQSLIISIDSSVIDWPLGVNSLPLVIKHIIITNILVYVSFVYGWNILGFMILTTSLFTFIADHYRSIVARDVLDDRLKSNNPVRGK